MKAMIRIAAVLLALPLVPAAAQRSIDAPGPVAHEAADTAFPERIGEFRRASVTQYDEAGRDISASYNLAGPEGRLLVSVYVYPAPVMLRPGPGQSDAAGREELCRREFAQVEEAIVGQYKDASRIEQGRPPAVQGVDARLSHRSVHRLHTNFGQGVEEVRSETHLYCFVGGAWLVKYRATSPARFNARREIESFIRAGPWPGHRPASPREIVAAPRAPAES